MDTTPLKKRVKILLVDDTPENLVSLEAALSPLREELVFAHSGREALRYLLHDSFAAILLDVKMPEMDGFETAELIRTRMRSRTTPILFLTAYKSDEHLFRGYDLGAVDFLFKPIVPEVLRSKVAVFVELTHKADELTQRATLMQRQAEVLKKAEQRFRSLLETAPDSMVICQTDGTIGLVNSKTEMLFGYSRQDLLDQDIRILIPDWSYELVSSLDVDPGEVVLRRMRGEGRFAAARKDGTNFPMELSLSPLQTDEGLLVINAIRDISERVAIEQERRRAEDEVRQLNAHLAGLNAKLEERVIERTEQLMASNQEVRRANEELERRVAQRTAELQKANERLNRSNEDLRRIEEQLRRSERQLIEAQHLAHLGSWNWDIQSDALTWSDEVYRIFGLDPGRFGLTHQAFLECVHPDDRVFVGGVIEKCVRTKGAIDCHFRIVQPDGNLRILYCHGSIVTDEHGNSTRIFGTLQDLTDRRMVEEQLKSLNQKLRALSASLQFAREEEGARIAREIHDELGSSLTSLKWDLEALHKALAKADSHFRFPVWREKISGMMKVIDNIINNVRRIASELRPTILDDLGLVEAIEWQAQHFQTRTGIVCRCNCPLQDACLNRDQSTAVFRIFQEALTNILRHAQATKVDILMDQAADEFVLRISDDGRGITEEDKFAQLSLGLLGMQERAHLIGGQVEISGIHGKGTRITVRVPLSSSVSNLQLHA
jgi:PAS domain S-box-containing protein